MNGVRCGRCGKRSVYPGVQGVTDWAGFRFGRSASLPVYQFACRFVGLLGGVLSPVVPGGCQSAGLYIQT